MPAQSSLPAATRYMQETLEALERFMEREAESLAAAVERITESVQAGGLIYLFGTGHSHMLAEEGHYRAGGLAAVCPILSSCVMLHEGAVSSSRFERTPGVGPALLAGYAPTARDTLIIFSNSGVNAAPVEMAIAAREMGLSVIAVVAVAYATQIPARIDGRKLIDVADVVLDNQGVAGDALVDLGDSGLRTGPLSTVAGAFILNAMLTEVASRLVGPGEVPPIYISANMPGAASHNEALVARFRSRNPHL